MTPQSADDHEARVKAGKDAFKRKLGLVLPEPVETYPERRSKTDEVAEKEIHRLFAQWCNQAEIDVIHAPMFKKSWLPNGFPDFGCFYAGKICFVEFKKLSEMQSKDNGLSADQILCHLRLEGRGNKILVTCQLSDAIKFTLDNLKG